MTEISILRRTALAATTLLLAACGPPAPPAYDPATLEPQVVARIDEAQAAVEQDPASVDAWAILGQVFQAHELNGQAVSWLFYFERGLVCGLAAAGPRGSPAFTRASS